MNLEKEVFELELADILPNRFQPREKFDDTDLQELATSIREHGVIQYSLEGYKINEFVSINEAARQTNSQPSKIVQCCQYERKSHNNYQWRYKEDEVSKLQKINEPQTKPKKVAQIDTKTGEIIAIYDSYCQAARAVNGTQSAITHVIKGDKNTYTHKGYGWKLVDDIVH